MTISYPLALPDAGGIRSAQIVLRRAQSRSQSPFTFQTQVYDWGGAAWEASITLAPLTQAQAGAWEGFFLGLRGMIGTFTMGDPARSAPLGTQQADFTLNGAHAARVTTIAVNGMAVGTTLLAGDVIGIGGTLHKIVQDATSDIIGEATLEIEPPLRAAQADGAAIDVTAPTGSWRLMSPDVEWSVDVGRVYGFSFAASEAL